MPEEVKRRRNNELLAVQNAICLEDNQPYLGRTVEILVEGPSKVARKQPPDAATVQLVGRTVCDRIVVFDGPRELTGKILNVTIEKVDPFTLFGKVLIIFRTMLVESRTEVHNSSASCLILLIYYRGKRGGYEENDNQTPRSILAFEKFLNRPDPTLPDR